MENQQFAFEPDSDEDQRKDTDNQDFYEQFYDKQDQVSQSKLSF